MIKINYHNITHDDQNNGDGLRVVLWVSGCSHHCFKCQNPQTWDENGGISFDINAKEEIFEQLSMDYISGITFSGGDPLYKNNLECISKLVDEIKEKFPDKTIWIYTGYTWEEIFSGYSEESLIRKHIITNTNVLVDGEYINELRDITLKWKGSSNQRVIDVQNSLKRGEVILWTT